MIRFLKLAVPLISLAFSAAAIAQNMQDAYSLPGQYLELENQYLKEFPQLQKVMDVMIVETKKQYAKPENDILHNRVCTALVYQMAKDGKQLTNEETRLAIAGDLLHNIAKGDKTRVLTDKNHLEKVDAVVKNLRANGYLKDSPKFWTDTTIYANPKLGNNLGHIHHLTGAVMAGEILKSLGYTDDQIIKLQTGIIQHSTGYWYFRSAVNDTLKDKNGWELVFPVPENVLSKYIHDADLISQFEYASVVPDGSKWRELATKRWKADPTPEAQAYIVYYVFQRLYEEGKTPKGKELSKAEWDKIAPELKKLMNLKPSDDPIAIKGVPEIFKGQ